MSVLFEEEDACWIELAADRLEVFIEAKQGDVPVPPYANDDQLIKELRELVSRFD